ncbi:hypothetical protein NXW23_18440 [Bacteroides caccae]|uniref:Uncharacterized protein n=1 Tax=Bacteroides caccae TaxID=47678 RepID=A0AA95BUE0_9BACE|nr:hypothetical protein NXW23_18440 [Bacteroides caccae]
MKEYVERIISSQCRIIDNKSGFIHIEGESAIFDMNGNYIGTAKSTIGSIRENGIDAVIKTLTNYKKRLFPTKIKRYHAKLLNLILTKISIKQIKDELLSTPKTNQHSTTGIIISLFNKEHRLPYICAFCLSHTIPTIKFKSL